MYIRKKVVQVQNRIPDQLSRAMVRNVSSTVNFIKSRSFLLQLSVVQKEVGGIATFPQGINMGMFYKKQVVVGSDLFGD